MNKERRKIIQSAIEFIEQAQALIEEARDGEQDYYDNMPESFQSGDKGDAAQTVVDTLQESYDAADEMIGSLSDAIGG